MVIGEQRQHSVLQVNYITRKKTSKQVMHLHINYKTGEYGMQWYMASLVTEETARCRQGI